jgi:hypothetical protein
MKVDSVLQQLSRRNVVSLLAIACLAAGCSVTPWVKPYDRERLDDPLMRTPAEKLSDRHFERVRSVREGARGAAAGQGGSCVCN